MFAQSDSILCTLHVETRRAMSLQSNAICLGELEIRKPEWGKFPRTASNVAELFRHQCSMGEKSLLW